MEYFQKATKSYDSRPPPLPPHFTAGRMRPRTGAMFGLVLSSAIARAEAFLSIGYARALDATSGHRLFIGSPLSGRHAGYGRVGQPGGGSLGGLKQRTESRTKVPSEWLYFHLFFNPSSTGPLEMHHLSAPVPAPS